MNTEYRWIDAGSGKPKYLEKSLSQCLSHLKSHTDRPGIKHGPQRCNADDKLPEP